VNGISRWHRPKFSRKFRPRLSAALAIAAVAAIAIVAGCKSAPALRLHYLPGFVPGSERIFGPVRIAVLPADGAIAAGRVRVGGVYSAEGSLERSFYAENLGGVVTAAVIRALSDAGLKPVASGPLRHGAASLPVGVDYALATSIEEASINQRFGAEQTVHGQYFEMKAKVRIKFTLSSRANPDLYTGEILGTEDEPPAPVGGEVFLPLETDPGESMSVALSRAVGALMLQSGFHNALPQASPQSPG
jgi:hypothetical protein